MLNWLIPMAGKSIFFGTDNTHFPKPLVDVDSKMMIERVLSSTLAWKSERQHLFVINQADEEKFHMGQILRHLVNNQCEIFLQRGETGGALCSCLLCVESIDNDAPLIISNADQVIDVDYGAVMAHFESRDADGGTIVFKSVHPQWSYVGIGEDGWVGETAEKKPISTDAIAGFYYFRRGRDFVSSAMKVIRNGTMVQGRFFISSALNEMILDGARIAYFRIDPAAYHSFYSAEMVDRYVSRQAALGRQNP